MKLVKSIAATAASLVVALTSAVVAQPGDNTAHEAYCEKVGATADEVFDYATSFEGWKLYDFRANGWDTNDSYWCAWYASTMLLDCNVPFPVPDFNLRIWVADILAGYLDEGRYIHTSSSTKGFVSQGGGKRVTSDMLLNCQNVSYSPEHGDLLFFDWGGDGLPDHIGFIDYVEGDRVHTLEGNPGILNGVYGDYEYTETKVTRVSRSPSYIIGYAKPDYISVDSEPADAACNSENNETTTEATESTEPKMIKITFSVDEGVFCDEHDREITWGTCTYDFPTPYKPNAKFTGWFDMSGNIIDCNGLITDDIELHARFEDIVEVTSSHSNGGGRHEEQPPTEETTVVVGIADDIDVQRDDIYHPVQVTEPPVQVTPVTEPEPVTERVPIQVETVSLSRYSKMLSTAGNSTSFTLSADAYPLSADDRSIRFESSNNNVARVDSRTGCVYAVADGECTIKAIASNGIYAACDVVVSTQYTTRTETVPVTNYESVPDSYDMECFCGRTIEGKVRQFFDHDISQLYDELGLSKVYGQWHHQWTFTAAEVDAAARISPGQQQGGSQNGTNACSATGYSMLYGDAYYIFFIKNINYTTVETVSYQTNTIRVPVEYN